MRKMTWRTYGKITIMKRSGSFLLFLILVFAIYLPLINKSYSSDDFQVLRRVVYAEHGILIKGFFRPLSDITLYGCYLLAGFHPLLYNIFNFITHSCIVYIIFLIAGRISWIPVENRRLQKRALFVRLGTRSMSATAIFRQPSGVPGCTQLPTSPCLKD